ncbi:MAG: GTP-binding protein, partial [Candidatus Helarchaeota archaeon]
MMVTTTIRYKMVLFGSAGVGKTSLVERFINDRFEEEYFSTLGYNVYEKVVPHNSIEISLMIFDIGGQERFRDLRKKYAEGADCAFIVYDVTNEVSYDEIKLWVKDLKEFAGEIPFILIGNKIDLEPRQVSLETAQKISSTIQA